MTIIKKYSYINISHCIQQMLKLDEYIKEQTINKIWFEILLKISKKSNKITSVYNKFYNFSRK